MEQKTIGRFIASLRKESGITQKQLAEKLNVSDKTISHWERGESSPDLSIIPCIADIFGVTCDELIRGERRNTLTEATEISEEKKEAEIINKLEKNFNKLHEKYMVSIVATLFGIIVGFFFGSLSKNVVLGILIFSFFIFLSIFGMLVSLLLYSFSLKNIKISKVLFKEYRIKGAFLGLKYMIYYVGFVFLILDIVIVNQNIIYNVYKPYLLLPLWFAIVEPVFFLFRSLDYKKKKFNKEILKSAIIISSVLLIVIGGTVACQQSYYKVKSNASETTMCFTDVYAFKQFIETENKVAFNRRNGETCYLYDDKDNSVEAQWNNELVTHYEFEYDENEEYIDSINAFVLPNECTDDQNRMALILFQCGFFVYPVIAVVSLAAFYIKLRIMKHKEKKIAD